jgi:tetratricopeptide (TPR) repeat protein
MKLDLAGYLSKQAIDAPSAPLFSRWRRRPRIWILGALLTLLVSLVMIMPSLISAAYLAAGTRALADSAAPAEHERAAQAAAYLKQALAWSPSSPDIYRALAQSYLRLNQPKEAIDALERAYRLRPESLLIQQELAQAYEAGGQTRRADALWAALGASAPEFLALGEQARAAGRATEALAWYDRAARLTPDLPSSIWYYRALALSNQGVREQAFEALRHATDDDKGWISPQTRFQAWRMWGNLLYNRRRFAEAKTALQKAITLFPADNRLQPALSDAYHFLGLAEWNMDRHNEAMQSLEKAVALNVESPWAHISYGILLYLHDRRHAPTTEAEFAAALKLRPGDAEVWKQLVSFWRRSGEIQRAEALCQEAQGTGVASALKQECPTR